MKVAIYTRVSSQEQANEGYSIHEQRKKLISFCGVHDWNDYEVFVDAGISGGSMNRPALKQMFDKLEYFDLILVYKLDRLTRNVRDLLEMLEMFESKNVSFKSATEVFDTTTAIGKLFITMVGAMAEWERGTIRERSLFGSRAAVREGNYIREAPFCYDNIDGKLVPNQYKWVIDYLIKEFKKGLSGNEIARRLNTRKLEIPKIKRWNRVSIIRLMKNPVLRGHTKYGDIFIENTHEPVISNDDYKSVIKSIEKKTYKSKHKHSAIFRGVLQCPKCQNKLNTYVGNIKSKDKKYSYEVRRYKCSKCKISFNESEAENEFVRILESYDLDKFKVEGKKEINKELKVDIDKIMSQREKLTRSWSLGYIEDDEYFKLMNETKDILKEVEEKEVDTNNNTITKEQLDNIENVILKGWKYLTIAQKSELVLSAIDCIEFEFVPKAKNKNGKLNTINIKAIHFKF